MATWRIHRGADSVTVTHLANAGRKGKKCLQVWVGSLYRQDLDLLDLLVTYFLETLVDNPAPQVVAAVANDVTLLSSKLEIVVSEKRGIDIDVAVIKVDTDLVQAHFSLGEFRITVTDIIRTEHGSFRQDSHMYNADKRSLPKAYAWARANAAQMGSMTRSEIYSGLRDAGVRVSTWG